MNRFHYLMTHILQGIKKSALLYTIKDFASISPSVLSQWKTARGEKLIARKKANQKICSSNAHERHNYGWFESINKTNYRTATEAMTSACRKVWYCCTFISTWYCQRRLHTTFNNTSEANTSYSVISSFFLVQ